MITNYDSPYYRALRQTIPFRDPRYLKAKKMNSKLVDLNQQQRENYTCVMCYQAIIDPKECIKCSTIFCT